MARTFKSMVIGILGLEGKFCSMWRLHDVAVEKFGYSGSTYNLLDIAERMRLNGEIAGRLSDSGFIDYRLRSST